MFLPKNKVASSSGNTPIIAKWCNATAIEINSNSFVFTRKPVADVELQIQYCYIAVNIVLFLPEKRGRTHNLSIASQLSRTLSVITDSMTDPNNLLPKNYIFIFILVFTIITPTMLDDDRPTWNQHGSLVFKALALRAVHLGSIPLSSHTDYLKNSIYRSHAWCSAMGKMYWF